MGFTRSLFYAQHMDESNLARAGGLDPACRSTDRGALLVVKAGMKASHYVSGANCGVFAVVLQEAQQVLDNMVSGMRSRCWNDADRDGMWRRGTRYPVG